MPVNIRTTDSLNSSDICMKNIMEDVVIEQAKLSLEAYPESICTCNTCICDICAIALNALPPRYITTDAGNIYVRVGTLAKEERIRVSVEIARAIEIVKKSPRH